MWSVLLCLFVVSGRVGKDFYNEKKILQSFLVDCYSVNNKKRFDINT